MISDSTETRNIWWLLPMINVGSSRYLFIMIAAKFAKIYPIKLPHIFYLQKYIKKAFFVQYYVHYICKLWYP